MAARTVRERIDPSITASLFSNYRSAGDAVLELVDNAVDSRVPERPLEVDLALQPQSLVVTTTGGEGMDPAAIERHYLRWGASKKKGAGQLGRYGQGGKAAVGHLGQSFTIESSRPGDTVAWRFSDPAYRDRERLKTYAIEEVTKRTDAVTGYVRIRIGGVDRKLDARVLEQRIADTYRPLLERGDLLARLNGKVIGVAPLPAVGRQAFRVNAAGRRLTGWFGVLDDEQPAPGWKPGLRCYSLGRLVADGELFGHPSPARLQAMARVVGEIDVPGVPLTMNKSDFDRDSPEWIAVEARMHRELAPLVRRLERDPDLPPTPAAARTADAVRRLLGRALRLAERPDLFAGMTAVTPRPATGGEPELPLEAEAPREPRGDRVPAAPRPAAEAGGARRRGFGNVVVRALDARVRSITTDDGGVTTIVINARYPLFIERRGDFLYQLETAAREIARGAEGSVADYERRVEQIVLTAVQLKSRRPRPSPAGRQLKLVR